MTGKRVAVTGAASGIGRATAVRFAESGAAAVALLDLHDEGNAETAILVEEVEAAALPVHVDLGSVSDIATAYQSVMTTFDRVDAAAHIGGFSSRRETLDVTGSCGIG